ncbi:PREDICTED: mitochondria-eating protein-like isoform X2 [Poecilia mexicana]|uniref:mitochondria-eating protein-like isoform X2 n=1 Tax=Poecilia mexicana TaxID=48701 RepID=UPI00072E4FAB|nr:PREDICTED: mitochondria-eating protein-like isoform X2 [Poecilia mexicana]XP_014827431.1 PREDICTED: mitochondria-eating protein-like isoform X2 [Poecilia mexicana]
MAEILRRLTNTSSFSVLQDKLENWHRDYHVFSCDQNVNRCCELIELTAKIQGQLFNILNITSAEGGHYGGVDTLKTRFLPWLGSCFSISRPSIAEDTSLHFFQDAAEKERKMKELLLSHESEIRKMEAQLNSTSLQLESVTAELEEAQKKLDDTKCKSATTLLATEDEILQLKAELVRSRSPSPLPLLSRSSSPLRSTSPTRAQLTNSSRHARLVSRFSDLYTMERLDAQSLLRRYIPDLEMVQRIIFIAVMESFQKAKLAYRQFKQQVRKTLSTSHFGPESLEDAAVDYIVRNLDLYDVLCSVNNVILAMNKNPQISFPPEVDFRLICPLIRETCRVAFAMQTLDTPLDLAYGSSGELFNNAKYRRSFDSDFSAPLVAYYVWPALVEGSTVVVKGEAVTKRGALWSRNRSRSASPTRSRSLSPARSVRFSDKRSMSPGRLTTRHL